MTRRESVFALAASVVAGPTDAPSATPGRKLNAVCVGGHPDDPESGCGGTLARYSAVGHNVTIIYLTRGEAGIEGKTHEQAARIRTEEAQNACKVLGAQPIFAGQIDGSTEIDNAAYRSFRSLLESQQPDVVSRIGPWIRIGTIARLPCSPIKHGCAVKRNTPFCTSRS